MATTSTKSAPRKRSARAKGNGKPNGSAKPKAKGGNRRSPRAEYDDNVKAISARAREIACPMTKQGPVPRQVQDIMTGIGDVHAALAEVKLSRKDLKALADNDSPSTEARAKLRTLAERVTGAKQWTRGRSLAATLYVWQGRK
jgi:hypothetical protein